MATKKRFRNCVSTGFAAMLTAITLAAPVNLNAAPHDIGKRPPGQFDYYVLALSWEPGFCATNHGHKQECSSPNGFVLHGLWPQMEGGAYPSSCSQTALSDSERQQWAGIYADPALIDHEWPKHGTCSGLSPTDYFKLSDADVKAVVIPGQFRTPKALKKGDSAEIKKAFIAANPGMTAAGLSVVAKKKTVVELDICVTKEGKFRPCS